jgi:hypothetical protein
MFPKKKTDCSAVRSAKARRWKDPSVRHFPAPASHCEHFRACLRYTLFPFRKITMKQEEST